MEIVFIYLSIGMIFFFSLLYIIKNVFSIKRLNFFSWYLLGIIISFVFPYFYLSIKNEDFSYFPKDWSTIVFGFLILLGSIILTYIGYVSGRSIKKIKNNYTNNKHHLFLYFISKLFQCYAIFIFVYSFELLIQNRSLIKNNMLLREIIFSKIDVITLHGVLVLLPMAVSIYYLYIYIHEKNKSALYYFIFYFILSLNPAFITGERTALIKVLLLSLLVIYERYPRSKYLIYSFSFIVLILYLYSSFKVTLLNSKNLFLDIIKKDFDMNWSLWYIIENTNLFYSKIISFPGSGYLYTFLVFLPRNIAPFKGYSSTMQFTYYYGIQNNIPLGASTIGQLNWQYKFGVMPEALINFGYLGVITISILLGIILWYMEVVYNKYKITYGIFAYISLAFTFLPFFTIITLSLPIAIEEIIMIKGLKYKKNAGLLEKVRKTKIRTEGT
ncbi:O-antigen polymerase [Caldanaerobius polysaccharolyticus]|uniref:O-antigen polymerase n=1 Tax=Caldanaerobius polysaccharolyticus TaxID=44256 RepID=UPI00047D6AA3|nr:O-antigen polymerase [Caldanaerobius polysaccharolyticus]